MNLARYLALAIFLAILFGVHRLLVIAVPMGFIPWLVIVGAIIFVAVRIENRERSVAGLPPYSWHDVGRDVRNVIPIAAFWTVAVLAALAVRHFI